MDGNSRPTRRFKGYRTRSAAVPARSRRDTEILRYYHRVKFLIDRHRRFLILGILSLIATDLAGIALPWLIKGGIDTALGASDAERLAAPISAVDSRRRRASGIFPLLLAHQHPRLFAALRSGSARPRLRALAETCRLSYFQRTKTGDLMSRLTNDIHAVRELMGFGSLAIVDAVGRDPFQSDLDDHHRSLAHALVDDGHAADSDRRALLRPGDLSLVARDPGTAEQFERLCAGKFFRHSRRPSLCPGAKPDRRLRYNQRRIPAARPCGWRRSGESSGRSCK